MSQIITAQFLSSMLVYSPVAFYLTSQLECLVSVGIL